MKTKCKNCEKIIDGLLCVECFNKGYINHDYEDVLKNRAVKGIK
jgi:hypothetical protein